MSETQICNSTGKDNRLVIEAKKLDICYMLCFNGDI